MSIEVIPCPGHRGAVDLVDSRYPDGERLHLPPGEWAEFVAAVKSGELDHAGDPPVT